MIHEIIYHKDYLLIVDPKATVIEGEICLFRAETDFVTTASNPIEEDISIQDIYWKIAAHLPLNNSQILKGIPLLPPLEEIDEEKYLQLEQKGQYKFTEEDMLTAFREGNSFLDSDSLDFKETFYNLINGILKPKKIPVAFDVLTVGSGIFIPAIGDYVYQDYNWKGTYIYAGDKK